MKSLTNDFPTYLNSKEIIFPIKIADGDQINVAGKEFVYSVVKGMYYKPYFFILYFFHLLTSYYHLSLYYFIEVIQMDPVDVTEGESMVNILCLCFVLDSETTLFLTKIILGSLV